MRTLRARLFGATLAALAITLALTLAIGAVLTRRQVDRSQAASIARRADDLAQQRRQHVNFVRERQTAGGVLKLVQPRATFAALVPDVNKRSDGETTYQGKRQLYSYRTIPSLGLILPSAALTNVLRAGLGASAGGELLRPLLVLLGWAVGTSALAARTFRWD